MPISTAALLIGPTISITGGTAQTFGLVGNPTAKGTVIADSAEANPSTRDYLEFRASNGAIQKDGSWSLDRRSCRVTSPDVDSNGKQQAPYGEVHLVCPPLMSAVKVPRIKEMLCQAIMDADFTAFWQTGTVV